MFFQFVHWIVNSFLLNKEVSIFTSEKKLQNVSPAHFCCGNALSLSALIPLQSWPFHQESQKFRNSRQVFQKMRHDHLSRLPQVPRRRRSAADARARPATLTAPEGQLSLFAPSSPKMLSKTKTDLSFHDDVDKGSVLGSLCEAAIQVT